MPDFDWQIRRTLRKEHHNELLRHLKKPTTWQALPEANDQPTNGSPKELVETLKLPWYKFGHSVYKKRPFDLGKFSGRLGQDSLEYVTKQNILKDTSVLWHTTGVAAKKALRMGQLNPPKGKEVLTSGSIKNMGKYHELRAKRAIDSGIQSSHDGIKCLIVEITQDRSEFLQPLERLINQDTQPGGVEAVFAAMQEGGLLGTYIQTLQAYKATLTTQIASISSDEFDRHREQKGLITLYLTQRIDRDIEAARELQGVFAIRGLSLHDREQWLRQDGNQAIIGFIKARSIASRRQAQCVNQIITHSSSGTLLRGDLNNLIEDDIKFIREFHYDLHNPIEETHQLAFADAASVTIDSDYFTDGSKSELDRLLMSISSIYVPEQIGTPFKDPQEQKREASVTQSGDREHDENDPASQVSQTSVEGSEPSTTPSIKKTNSTKWKDWLGYFDRQPFVKGFFSEWWIPFRRIVGLFQNLVIGIANTIETAILGNRASFFGKYLYEPEKIKVAYDQAKEPLYYILKDQLQKKDDISSKIGLLLNKIFCDVVIEGLIRGFWDGLKRLLKGFGAMATDASTSLWGRMWAKGFVNGAKAHIAAELPKADLQQLFKDLALNLTPIIKSESRLRKEVEEEFKLDADKFAKDEKGRLSAIPNIPLTPYHSHGLINSTIGGGIGFIDLFGHHMFAKHPFTASISSAAAALSFMAFFSPHLLGGSNGFVKFLLDQGFIWAKDPVPAALAGAFTNFKLTGAGIEFFLHGPKSWLAKSFSYLYESPVVVGTILGLSFTVGYLLLHPLNVPWLSDELRAHVGSSKELAELFGGGKVLVVGYEVMATPLGSAERAKAIENYIDACVVAFQDYMAKKTGKPLSEEQAGAIRQKLTEQLNPILTQIQQPTPDQELENPELALISLLSRHPDKLSQLEPQNKARLREALPQLLKSEADCRAIEKLLDPERYAPKSTTRSFLARVFDYVSTLIRCATTIIPISPTFLSARPWRTLGEIIRDDLTSTFHALGRLLNKVFETLFNRLPRTIADIFLNGVFARIESRWRGTHEIAMWNYDRSADWDIAQETTIHHAAETVYHGLTRVGTLGLTNDLVSANTSPAPTIALRRAQIQTMAPLIENQGIFAKQNQMGPENDSQDLNQGVTPAQQQPAREESRVGVGLGL